MLDIYQVGENDNLETISKMFKSSENAILKENNLNSPDDIKPGIKIIIPQQKEQYYNTYTVQKGDNLYQIARNYNINPELLAAFNGLNFDDYIYPNEIIMIPKNNYSYYLTAKGDTLSGVIDVLSSNKDKLLNENETIYLLPGQLIVNKK